MHARGVPHGTHRNSAPPRNQSVCDRVSGLCRRHVKTEQGAGTCRKLISFRKPLQRPRGRKRHRRCGLSRTAGHRASGASDASRPGAIAGNRLLRDHHRAEHRQERRPTCQRQPSVRVSVAVLGWLLQDGAGLGESRRGPKGAATAYGLSGRAAIRGRALSAPPRVRIAVDPAFEGDDTFRRRGMEARGAGKSGLHQRRF